MLRLHRYAAGLAYPAPPGSTVEDWLPSGGPGTVFCETGTFGGWGAHTPGGNLNPTGDVAAPKIPPSVSTWQERCRPRSDLLGRSLSA